MPIHSYLQRGRVYILGREITSYILREREGIFIFREREGIYLMRENNIYLERDYNDIFNMGYRDHINSITHTSYRHLILSMHPSHKIHNLTLQTWMPRANLSTHIIKTL
jgi:hypothetical protein